MAHSCDCGTPPAKPPLDELVEFPCDYIFKAWRDCQCQAGRHESALPRRQGHLSSQSGMQVDTSGKIGHIPRQNRRSGEATHLYSQSGEDISWCHANDLRP